MELITNPQPHDCQALARQFQVNFEADGDAFLRVGAELKCDCGTVLQLKEHQFDGPYWAKIRASCGGRIR